LAEIELGDGTLRRGQVLDISSDRALVQIFEGTDGMDVARTKIRFSGKTQELGVSPD